jgi:HlyD family secretion protein
VLTAPIAGVVLLRNFLAGEVANPGQPVLTLGDPDRLWMRVYVSPTQLARLRLGQAVDVTVRGLRQTFHGRIVEIATEAEFTPRAALTEEERANLVFGVKVRLDPSGGALKAGLPADAIIPQGAASGATKTAS